MKTTHQIKAIQRANKELSYVESAPLSERKEGRDNYLQCLTEYPDAIIQEADHVLRGDYGYGFYLKIWDLIIESPRMNHAAILGQWVANRRCGCPARFAREAWNKLSKEQQDDLTAKLEELIKEAKEAMGEWRI